MINKFIYYPKIDSTNQYLKDNIDNYSSGVLIYTDFQSKGRGRRGHSWESQKAKNLTFSYLLKNQHKSIEDFMMIVTVSIVKTLKEYNIDARIKLPNDILVNNQKISGVLIENIIRDKAVYSIIGIGLNVNQIFNQNWTSMKQELSRSLNRNRLLKIFVDYFNEGIDTVTFEEYKKHVKKPTQVRYENKCYEWVDFNAEWQCFIKSEGRIITTSVEDIKFDYALYL